MKFLLVMSRLQVIWSLLLLLLIGNTQAQDSCFPEKPRGEDHLVYQFYPIMPESEANALDNKLQQFSRNTGTQILVVVVDDLCGYDKAMFTFEIGEKWGIGQKGFDNGVVIMVKPTGGQGQRHTFIATGYGLEAVIPDLTAQRIVDAELIPNFKKQNYYQGLNEATDVLMSLAEGEYSAEEYKQKTSNSKEAWIGALIMLLIFAIVFFSKFGAARRYAHTNNTTFWTAYWILASANRNRSGHYGRFRSGESNFGSGGFGGFGGGSFGGGGAGGSW